LELDHVEASVGDITVGLSGDPDEVILDVVDEEGIDSARVCGVEAASKVVGELSMRQLPGV
jgi:hypothetical protein